jgi:hypothetical protein
LKLGDTVAMEYNSESKFAILAKEEEKRLSAKDIPELDDWLKKFNAKYKTALSELSNK